MARPSEPKRSWPDLVASFLRWGGQVADGADPIEAMHGHLCGPRCWHWEAMSAEQKAKLLKAPWNRRSDP